MSERTTKEIAELQRKHYDDWPDDDRPCATPLIELLDGVPKDARMTYEHHGTSHQMIPVGWLCFEAAERIKQLQAENERLKANTDETVAIMMYKTDKHIKQLEADKEKALELAEMGAFDGAHHKMWVIDQMVRALTEEEYGAWVAAFKAGEDGPDTYDWDEGIAP